MWCFGDGFDLYTNGGDVVLGYWDAAYGGNLPSFPTGRYPGSRSTNLGQTSFITKTSGSNDAIHHISFAAMQPNAIAGTTMTEYFSFRDGSAYQCTIGIRSDGTIIVASGNYNGTVLATWPGVLGTQNQWLAFEFEVVIHQTAGSVTARVGGAVTNTYQVTNVNTRAGSANSYANQLYFGSQSYSAPNIDDLLWRSDSSSVPWIGDIRCYTRMPANDVVKQFSAAPATVSAAPNGVYGGLANNTSYYTAFTAVVDGLITTAGFNIRVAYTGNMKAAIFANTAGNLPGAVLATATTLALTSAVGIATWVFPTPTSVTKGQVFWLGFQPDTTLAGSVYSYAQVGTSGSTIPWRYTTAVTYASFPTANPSGSNPGSYICLDAQATIAPANNWSPVAEPQQNGTVSYIFGSTVGDGDFYGIASINVTPASTIAVTTRQFAQKSDPGSRSGAVRLKSGGTTVQSTPGSLNTTFTWNWRIDLTDPATSAPWTAAGVNNVQIGPVLIA